ncbi:hypothetical protein DFH09DRAFT_1097103 [Mycena vulgaris]|nr:hypothetical protein DFH09DRAFT_1097103 [Mycena vulgaris]
MPTDGSYHMPSNNTIIQLGEFTLKRKRKLNGWSLTEGRAKRRFRTGPPAGTRRPTRTRTRQYRTRPTRGFKPVRVTRGSLIYPRFLRKTADRNAAAIWHGTLFSRPQKAGTASAECRLRLPSTRGLTRAGPRYCGGSEISTRTRTRQTLGSKPANGPDTRAEPYGFGLRRAQALLGGGHSHGSCVPPPAFEKLRLAFARDKCY